VKKWPISKIALTIILFACGIIFLLPFIWMISTSLKVEQDVFKFPIEWIPSQFNGEANYKKVWLGDYPFYLYYWNTIKVTILTTFTSVLVSSMAAYGFTKVNFRGNNFLFLIVLATFMVPQQSIIVPQFLLMREIKLFDTHLGLVLLGSFSVLGTFMLRQFFMSINNEFIEAARIDGAGHARIFLNVTMPMIRPAIATYGILRFIWTWNDYQNPLIFLRTDKYYTLQLAMNKFSDTYGQFYSLTMAAAVSAIIPLLIVFLIGQKQVIEGIALGGVKG